MKVKSFLLFFTFSALFTFSVIATGSATVVTFDELSETGSGGWIASQYQGLNWSNILCNNAILWTNIDALYYSHLTNGLTGDYYGMVSESNVAEVVADAEIDSPGTSFNFLSAYLTGYFNSNLNIEVKGFKGVTLLYDQTVIASAATPIQFAFDYLDIDRLTFTSFGGQPAFRSDLNFAGEFVMDNFAFELIPEPSSLLLTFAGALLLWPLLKHKRA